MFEHAQFAGSVNSSLDILYHFDQPRDCDTPDAFCGELGRQKAVIGKKRKNLLKHIRKI